MYRYPAVVYVYYLLYYCLLCRRRSSSSILVDIPLAIMPTLAKKRKALVNPTKAVEARRKRKVRADKQKEADRP